MKLYIAEKPTLGRAIAAVLPKPHRQEDGCIWLGNGDCVSWCVGHLLEQAEPEAYDPAYKKWLVEHLPIVPEKWQLKPRSQTRKQLTVLRKLVKQANYLVHAGDPDREGQLLVDEVLDYLGVRGKRFEAVERCLISDLNPSSVTRSLKAMRSNREFLPLSVSALARSRADWLYGINMTRAYTLQGRKVGFQGLLSVGRVQTPVLGLVVRRDQEVERFERKPFFEVWADLVTETNESLKAKWLPSEACRPHQDDEGRILNRNLAENVAQRIQGKIASVDSVVGKEGKQPAPLPYNLSALQIDAAKAFGLSAKQVLDLCQQLYERHKLITYPRSDCRYLPKQHFSDVPQVTNAIVVNCPEMQVAVDKADLNLRGRAWNDARVTAHHAIIPTQRALKGGLKVSSLDSRSQQLYQMIARQYLMQFYGAFCYKDTRVLLALAGGQFEVKARMITDPGWKLLLPAKAVNRHGAQTQTQAVDEGYDQKANGGSADLPVLTLPILQKGDQLPCIQGEVRDKHTQPPKYFTDATLLAAMTGIARYVSDPELRKVLRDTDGLGTEATRAGIIELLFQRKYLQRSGKQIRAGDVGKALIESLPVTAASPDMTARWEAQLEAICERQSNYQSFMSPLLEVLQGLISQSQAELLSAFIHVKSSSAAWKGSAKRKKTGKFKKSARSSGSPVKTSVQAGKPFAGKRASSAKRAGNKSVKKPV